ncbi:hypothetical protein BDV19DRAFT_184225 [Aspergillus venezuelensis]
MLRAKPTRVALTEDDLCYHIDSIFARNNQLTKWHRQRTGSGNSYDGDDDEDGLFYDSDSFSVPETFYESECDETQSQPLPSGNPQEPESRSGNQNTTTGASSGHRRPVTVRFLSPEPSPLSPNRSGSRNRNRDSVAIARNKRTQHVDAIEIPRVGGSNSRPSIPRPFLSSTDWRRNRRAFPVTSPLPGLHPLPRNSLVPGPPQPTKAVLEANFAGFLPSLTVLPIRISRREGVVEQLENSRVAPLHGPHSIEQYPKAVLRSDMKRTGQAKSITADRASDESGPSNSLTPEPETGASLTDIASNSGGPALQYPASKDGRKRSSWRRSGVSKAMVPSGNQDGHIKHPRASPRNTVSRATQTDSDLAPSTQNVEDDAPHDLIDGPLDDEENISLDETTEQENPQRHWQDLFISAMFPEPDPPAFDATNQILRGMQAHVSIPTNRGRGGRNERGEIVHPTLVDASFFQEYVHQLIAELDRAL